jgi:exostosin family protein
MTLPIFSDRSYIPDGEPHAVMLFPFWGRNEEDPADPNTGRFDGYAKSGQRLFRLAPLEDADLAVFPREWGYVEGDPAGEARAEEFVARAREAGAEPVIFFWSDLDGPVPFDAVVFRTSFYRSRRRPREFAQPAWSEDFVERHLGGELPLRSKRARPVVGFCGLAPTGWRRYLLLAASRRPEAVSTLRARVLAALDRDRRVETNFMRRKHFLGGAAADEEIDPVAMQRVRREYVQNMVESDYVVCARGAGNFSYRLYEALSCGRIPVFVDTDCVLPYDFLVDWRDYCVWVDAAEVGKAGEKVAEFHERLTDGDFADLQRACRRLWEDYIRPEGFFAHFHRHFERVPTR